MDITHTTQYDAKFHDDEATNSMSATHGHAGRNTVDSE